MAAQPSPGAAPTHAPQSFPGVAQPLPAPIKRKTSPLVWVLVIVLGIFVVGGIGLLGTAWFFVHKAKQAGFDTNLIERNPAYAAAKMVVALNPDLTEVRHDDRAGTITVRDNKTGQEVTVSFDDIQHGKLKFTATDETGKTATMEIGGAASRLPSWAPVYPGSEGKGTFSIRGDAADGAGANYTFTTKDPPSKVIEFYQEKAQGLGMKVDLDANSPPTSTMTATDQAEKRQLTVVAIGGSGETTVNVTYSEKK